MTLSGRAIRTFTCASILGISLLPADSQAASKANQTITFPPPADRTFGDPPFVVLATASSGLAVKIASQTTGVCTVAGVTVTLKGAGACTLRASQAGNARYNAAPTVDRSFAVAPRPIVVTLGGLDRIYNGRQRSATCATIPAGRRTSLAYSDVGAGVDRVNAGDYGVTCMVTQAGYTGHAVGTLRIAKAGQRIAFGSLVPRSYGDPPFTIAASTGSGLAASFASLTPDVCTLSGTVVTLVGAGICTIEASQAGNANYHPAANVARNFRVKVKVALGDLNQVYDGTRKSATCSTMPAGFATEIRYSDLGAGTGRVNAGSYGVTCRLIDAGQSGQARGTLVIAKANQVVTFEPLAGRTLGDAPFTVAATASSGLAVTMASLTLGVCSVSGNTVTLATAGTCTLEASQAGNSNYNAAPSVDQSFPVAAASDGLHYLAAYDSMLLGDWTLATWEDADHPISANPDADAPGRAGKAIDVRYSANGWGAFGLGNMRDWNHINFMYLNEFRTIDFDIYFANDATGIDKLQLIVEDGGYSSQPALVSYIPGFDPAHPENSYGQWFHVTLDLTSLHVTIPRFTRFLFWNGSGESRPHFHMANVRLGWMDDTVAPVVTLGSATPSLNYDALTLRFTTNEHTIYRVEYGVGSYGFTVAGDANAWSTSHTAVLPNLIPGMTYQYRIVALDHRTDPGAASNQGVFAATFAMPPIPTTPPVISGLSANGVKSHKANVTWNTDVPCAAVMTYQKNGGIPLTRSLSDFALTRSFELDLLEASTEYTVTVRATDAFGNFSTASITLTTTDSSTADVIISVDAGATRPISPHIYGTNQDLGASHFTFGRLGGNRWTTYNWTNNASNAGVDWFNWSDGYLPWIYGVPDNQFNTPGIAVLAGLNQIFATNAGAALITVPIQGYVAADRGTDPNDDVIATGPNYLQQRFKTIQLYKGAPFTTDPVALAGQPHVYTDEYVSWVKTVAKAAHPGKSVFYSLDNEPDIWFGTHPRVAPQQESYNSLITKNEEAAKAIKSVDADATVFGFVSYGWFGYTYLQGAPDGSWSDHNTYGDFTEYYLARMSAAETHAGKRLVDVLDLHYYTEARTADGSQGVQSSDVSPDVVAARVQSTRSLWDPTYVENSWITTYAPPGDQPIRLIPRMHAKIDSKYPGTKLALTEYNFRGGHHISGAIAQADALGIFGRHGLFAATRWRMDTDEHFTEAAFRMYRGFDGAQANFGDISVATSSSDVSKVAVYVSQDSTAPGRVVIVAINRSGNFQDVEISGLALLGTARVYRLDADAAQPVFVGQVSVNGTSWFVTLPPMSISTIEIQ